MSTEMFKACDLPTCDKAIAAESAKWQDWWTAEVKFQRYDGEQAELVVVQVDALLSHPSWACRHGRHRGGGGETDR